MGHFAQLQKICCKMDHEFNNSLVFGPTRNTAQKNMVDVLTHDAHERRHTNHRHTVKAVVPISSYRNERGRAIRSRKNTQ